MEVSSMRRNGLLMALCIICGLVNFGAAPPEPQNLRLWHSDDRSLVLEFSVADLHSETVVHEGVTYHLVTLPGLAWTTEVGSPQVPMKGVLLGAPGGNARVEVLESDYETLWGYNLYPSPALVIKEEGGVRYAEPEFALDAAVYATDAFYPGRLAEIGFSGYMRDQAVVQLRLYPLQYNPVTGEARLYRRVRVRVTFDTAAGAKLMRPAGGTVYERLLQNTLLNYASLGRQIDGGPRPGSDLAGQEISAAATPSPTLKIFVTQDGIYELVPSDLQSAGLDLAGLDPCTIKISNRGTEIPIYVQGENDGSFDTGDYIAFYGTAITDVFTIENVYWLTSGGENGQRMAARDGTPGSGAVPAEFYDVVHAEEDNTYWEGLPNGEGQDHYFWEQLTAPVSRTYSTSLNNIANISDTGQLTVALRGKTDTPTYPDHHTRVYLNGTLISEDSWDGQIEYQHQATISQTQLLEGVNTIVVESVGDTGSSIDILYHNWVEIGYWDTYVAESDVLEFRGPGAGTYKFEVSGFTADTVEIFDITTPISVSRIISSQVELAGSTYLARFEDTCGADTCYLALTPGQHKSPANIVLDEPSDWKSTTNGADYVIITHQDFYSSALTLASYREDQGLRTETVKITDVYDEFNYGIFSPQAIQDFLAYAYENWTAGGPPEYVLLMGDANMDYKDNLGTGNINYVPTHLIETWELGETPSDNWFVCVSGDDILPDMFLGRISVRTSADADAVINKIITYEQSPPAGDWNRAALFVADDDETTFESLSEELIALLPGGFDPHRVYVRQYSAPDDPTADIISYIDDGVVMVNYTGHGNVDNWAIWAGGRIFQTSDIASLNNGGKLPFVTTANCLNGFFSHPYTSYAYSLAEEFLRVNNKGALAAWAPTGLGYPSGHRTLISELYGAIFTEGDHVIGSATTAAKIATYAQSAGWGDLVETFVLFGDPASQLDLPPYPAVTGITPDASMVSTSISTVISGTNFVDGATVELVQGTDVVTATETTVFSATGISCTLDLAGAAAGLWDVRVTNPDDLFGTLSDAFTISWHNIYLPVTLKNYP